MSELLHQIELLTGQISSLREVFDKYVDVNAFEKGTIGVSVMNELLLFAGFDRVTEDFFMFLCTGTPKKYEGVRINGIGELKKKVKNIRVFGALKYGNFKFAFKKWANMSWEELGKDLSPEILPVKRDYFMTRGESIDEIKEIPLDDRVLLGYISGYNDAKLSTRRDSAEKIGRENLRKYINFDHMDVYVATSMRKYGDYVSVGSFVRQVFDHPRIKALKLRYFDPTQVYSIDRFCKGLVESLMLKRAKCCIYCVQETDTLGKDSELATTLVQGKSVIAWVPEIKDIRQYGDKLIADSKMECPDNPKKVLAKYYMTVFPEVALENVDLIGKYSLEELSEEIAKNLKERFEYRAQTLLESHPLAMQADINTGVAHGVLVVRNAEMCSEVLYKVLNKELEFYIKEIEPREPEFATGDYTKTYILIEKLTSSPYRVVIGDAQLTNSFWNFYLK